MTNTTISSAMKVEQDKLFYLVSDALTDNALLKNFKQEILVGGVKVTHMTIFHGYDEIKVESLNYNPG